MCIRDRYTFYRSFAYCHGAGGSSSWKTLSLGEFFDVLISCGGGGRRRSAAVPAVGELQLIWETSGGQPGQKLASVKLYFVPEQTPAGRQPSHGQVLD